MTVDATEAKRLRMLAVAARVAAAIAFAAGVAILLLMGARGRPLAAMLVPALLLGIAVGALIGAGGAAQRKADGSGPGA